MATRTTPTSPAAWRPDVQAFTPADVIPNALLLTCATVAGAIEGDQPSLRVPYVRSDGTPGFVAEGQPIPETDQQFDEVVVTTDKVAALGKYSYEILQQPQAARLVVDSLSRSVTKSANAAFIANVANPVGLLTTAGITDGGAITTDLDELIDAVSGIEGDGGNATHVIASPGAWAFLSKLKSETASAQPLLGAGTSATQRQLLGLPVVVDAAVPDGDLLVIDKGAIIAAQSPVRLARSEEAYFVSDVVAVRVTWRIGWSVMHTKRVVKLTT